MAEQLNHPPSGGSDIAPAAADGEGRNNQLPLLTLREIAAASRQPAFLITMAAVILLPLAQGAFYRPDYVLEDADVFFELQIGDFFGLLFPLLVAGLHLPRLADELRNGFTRSVRTRVPLGTYLTARVLTAAVLSFVTFAAAVTVAWLMAHVVDPALGLTTYEPRRPGETPMEPLTERMTFSQLHALGPWAFVLGYAGWVGLMAATYAVIGALALMIVENRFVALSLPFLIYSLGDFTLAVLGLEGYGLTGSVFPTAIIQQPLWHVLPQWGFLLAIIGGMVWWLRRRELDTPALA